MLPDPLHLVGTTVSEKYEIERVVGEGGFALVYRANHRLWKRPVALKVFRALGDLPADKRAGLVEDFIQEGRLLAELSERSAAICQARDVGELVMADGRTMPFMVLEWLEGRSLEQVMDDERAAGMPPRTAVEVVRILEPAAEALALAHRQGIAHRDVKPANIFVLGDPRGELTVKLLDFGIAKVVQDIQRLGGSFQKTAGHVSSFTPAYGAPEQFSRQHGPTGPWTDVFALALVFTELMTHRPALTGDDLTQLAFCSMDPRRRPTPRTLGAAVPDALEAVLRRALAVETSERYASMGELWQDVRAALGMGAMRGMGAEPARITGPGLPSAPLSSPVRLGAGVTGPTAPNFATTTAPGSQPSPIAPGPASAAAPKSGTSLPLLLGGLGAFALLAAVGTGLIVYRGKAPIAPATSATVSASPAAPPPPPTCPEGMARIPGGKFFMGSDDREDLEEERPAHQVTLPAYCMDVTEVTVEAYKGCSDRGECKRAPRENDYPGLDALGHKLYDPLCNIREPEQRAKHPINCVDWELSDAYCKAVGKRLPTEAEWEFATRGSDGRKYPWGDEPPTTSDLLNACGTECVAWGKAHPDRNNPLEAMYRADDGFETTAPVGSFPRGASQFGLKDVVGNVWEWVSDWNAPYTAEAQVDPKGPPAGDRKGLRGGAWNGADPAWVRPTYRRFAATTTFRSHGIGFRCARSLELDAGAR